ncbi:hypothetical protein [Streptomyces africanus]|uniref:hypothetical protein n=1 Tax=Streptomyces africanus TaxID=231024 RepID=UPI00117D8A16|nr:hypothetical protein [Streptomyces africanus]
MAARFLVADDALQPVGADAQDPRAPERDTQHPSGRRCRMRGRLPGAPGPGTVFPREAALALGTAGPDADPAAWTLLLQPPAADARWVTETGHVVARRPQLSVLWRGPEAAERQGLCRRPGCYLIRVDGHIAAHGHAGDLDRLEAELGLQLIPGAR